jgi:hypothetical protein
MSSCMLQSTLWRIIRMVSLGVGVRYHSSPASQLPSSPLGSLSPEPTPDDRPFPPPHDAPPPHPPQAAGNNTHRRGLGILRRFRVPFRGVGFLGLHARVVPTPRAQWLHRRLLCHRRQRATAPLPGRRRCGRAGWGWAWMTRGLMAATGADFDCFLELSTYIP